LRKTMEWEHIGHIFIHVLAKDFGGQNCELVY